VDRKVSKTTMMQGCVRGEYLLHAWAAGQFLGVDVRA
jgi:hypothetical protein